LFQNVAARLARNGWGHTRDFTEIQKDDPTIRTVLGWLTALRRQQFDGFDFEHGPDRTAIAL
jgi:hypothetical protein